MPFRSLLPPSVVHFTGVSTSAQPRTLKFNVSFLAVPLDVGQGCIAGPRHNADWVGIYWLAPTLFYTATFALALIRSRQSLANKPLGAWKLMLRDGLNLYGAIWIVNMVNMLFWFIITPTGPADSIKTIVTSMAAVLTTSMTLRIILGVRGTLAHGGSFAGASSASSGSRSTRVTSGSRSQGIVGPNIGHTFDLSQVGKAAESGEWNIGTEDRSMNGSDGKGTTVLPVGTHGTDGVKITVDQAIEYDAYPKAK